MAPQRRYWVVSPNVRNDKHTVGDWRNASVRRKAAFMGWGLDHPLGEKFAYSVQPGDLILIARSHNKQPEIVGFGCVTGKFKTSIKGFTPPAPFSTLRTLSPFKAMSRPPRSIPLIAALNQSAAIHELHPDWNTAHESICAWMDERLSVPDERQAKKHLRMREQESS